MKDYVIEKRLNLTLKIIAFSVIGYIEQFVFYKTILCNMMTKRSSDMWLTFILGSFFIAAFNLSAEYFLIKNKKLKSDSSAVISSLSICLCTLILSLRRDGGLLQETDYLHEVSYAVLFILSVSVSLWVIVFKLLSGFTAKIKK